MGDDTKQVKVAHYLGPSQHTRIIEAKQFNRDFFSNVKEDLVWEEANRWRVNVTDAPPELIEYLESDSDFELEDHEQAVDEDAEAAPEGPAEGQTAQPAPDAEPGPPQPDPAPAPPANPA